jgi:hypothetical protein
LWQDHNHRAAKLHLAFEVFRAGPADATLTVGTGSEREQLKTQLLQPGRLYVLDRGYESYELLAQIRAQRSSFVARLQQDAAYELDQERVVSVAARSAGVVRDVVIKRLGTAHHTDWHKGQALRLVWVEHPTARPGEERT